MSFAILTDLTKCIGCGACALACKEVNGLPPGDLSKLSAQTFSALEHRGTLSVRRQCMHCLSPTCASVCPVAALERMPSGPVIYHEERCIGCRYCLMACPFEIPTYEWESRSPRVRKCHMCFERQQAGGQPGCTSVCPTGATIFGDRAELLKTAQERIRDNPGRYVDWIYGQSEAGGTSVLYLSDVAFDQAGFRQVRRDGSYPELTWSVLSQLPSVVSVGGVLLCGVWWITHRRMKLEREQPAGTIDMDTTHKGEKKS